ncbi:hypothetical protein HY086_04145 [Candidatus Gottesmanbacteria bacterium]|nr:hypothetical protein [Candidatus Gottesmanbacteria bacterium]
MRTNIPSQIIGSFEDIGKDVLKQTAQVPKDIVGKAIESIGTAGSKKQGQPLANARDQQAGKAKEGALGELDSAKDEQVKKAIARSALEQLAGKPKQKEPSVWEKIQMEIEQKKQQQQQQKQASAQALPAGKGKRPRGDLYGLKAKKASAEMSRNVRQD